MELIFVLLGLGLLWTLFVGLPLFCFWSSMKRQVERQVEARLREREREIAERFRSPSVPSDSGQNAFEPPRPIERKPVEPPRIIRRSRCRRLRLALRKKCSRQTRLPPAQPDRDACRIRILLQSALWKRPDRPKRGWPVSNFKSDARYSVGRRSFFSFWAVRFSSSWRLPTAGSIRSFDSAP